MLYETRFLYSLLITSLVEIPIVLVLVRYVFERNKKKTNPVFILVVAFIASALTLPYLWFILHPYIDARLYVIWGEFWVFVAESFIYWQLLKIRLWEACILSLVANVSSYAIGQLL